MGFRYPEEQGIIYFFKFNHRFTQLTHYSPMFLCWTPWKRQKTTKSFLTFSGGVEMRIGRKWVNLISKEFFLTSTKNVTKWVLFLELLFAYFDLLFSCFRESSFYHGWTTVGVMQFTPPLFWIMNMCSWSLSKYMRHYVRYVSLHFWEDTTWTLNLFYQGLAVFRNLSNI